MEVFITVKLDNGKESTFSYEEAKELLAKLSNMLEDKKLQHVPYYPTYPSFPTYPTISYKLDPCCGGDTCVT